MQTVYGVELFFQLSKLLNKPGFQFRLFFSSIEEILIRIGLTGLMKSKATNSLLVYRFRFRHTDRVLLCESRLLERQALQKTKSSKEVRELHFVCVAHTGLQQFEAMQQSNAGDQARLEPVHQRAFENDRKSF